VLAWAVSLEAARARATQPTDAAVGPAGSAVGQQAQPQLQAAQNGGTAPAAAAPGAAKQSSGSGRELGGTASSAVSGAIRYLGLLLLCCGAAGQTLVVVSTQHAQLLVGICSHFVAVLACTCALTALLRTVLRCEWVLSVNNSPSCS